MGRINYRAPNLVCVCVDEMAGKEFSGRVYNRYSDNPTSFSGVSDMLGIMDSFFNTINYPQASTKTRSFKKKTEADSALRGASREVETMATSSSASAVDLSGLKGGKATFIVQVQYRQHATWQGSVVWAEKNISQNFRSALELLKLIDSSLDEVEGKV